MELSILVLIAQPVLVWNMLQPGAFVEVSDPSKKCAVQSDMRSDTCLDDEALEKSLCLLIYAAVCCLVSL